MKFKAQIQNLNFSLTGAQNLTLTTTEDMRGMYDELKGKELSVEIKPHFKRRSMNANAYMWVLCDKLAEVLQSTKEDVYIHAIKQVGVFRSVTVDEKAFNTLRVIWTERGAGWVVEKLDEHDGFIDVALYYGSSCYNTKQLARLLDLIIEECKECGIDTMTPAEIAELKAHWKVRG